jgi:hypothetical protein
VNRLFAFAFFASLFPIVLGGGDSQAVNTLIKALEAQRDVRVCMVQSRSDGGQTVTVSVQIVPRRGVRATITQPLIYAGIVSYDNGDYWKNFDPHMNVVRIEKSPATFQMDIGRRKKLIEKNFETTFGGEAMIAGRRTKVVLMKGRHEGMASRRLYVDAENSLILRYIVQQPDSDPITTVDTKSIDLDPQFDLGELESIGGEGAKVVKAWGPIELRQAKDAEKYVGFVPQVPSSLAAGLQTQAIHVVGTEQRPFVGVRLTDGMAIVTVYLWKAGEDEPFKGDYDSKSASGVRCKVVGEVSDAVQANLARAFTRLYEGPSSSIGTYSGSNGVFKEQKKQGGKTPERPRLVIEQ